LQLGRAFLVLQDQELKAERFLGLEYRRMSSGYAQIKAARAQRESFATQLRVRYDLYRVGANEPGTGGRPVTLNLLLEAQLFSADALATEYQPIVTYNNAICGWEYAKGTILQHDNVTISEGPIPVAAQKRAVEHMRERTKALVLRERAAPTGVETNPLTRSGPINLIPQINANSLPSIWKDMPPITDADSLSQPDKIDTGETNPLREASKDQVFPPSELPSGASSVPAPAPTPYAPSSPVPTSSKLPPKKSSDFGALRPVSDTGTAGPAGA